jgi:hypothetical protein
MLHVQAMATPIQVFIPNQITIIQDFCNTAGKASKGAAFS